MSYLPIYLVAFLASLLGPLCGIGGGVIIKPVVDAMQVLPVATVSFLSSLSVLTMSLATLLQNRVAKTSSVKPSELLPLALGSAAGGVAGKALFAQLSRMLPDAKLVGAVQSAILVASCVVVFAYTLKKDAIQSLHIERASIKAAIGFAAGAIWAFLGIGGGPFNLAILAFCFSMDSKPAAQGSLFIIAFSQAASFIYTLVSGGLPFFTLELLFSMCTAAVAGSVLGRQLARRASASAIDRLYLFSLILIAAICCYNFLNFVGVI